MIEFEVDELVSRYKLWKTTSKCFCTRSVLGSLLRSSTATARPDDTCRMGRCVSDTFRVLARCADIGVEPSVLNGVIQHLDNWFSSQFELLEGPRFEKKHSPEESMLNNFEVQLIREAASANKDKSVALRDGCMVDLLFAGGIRSEELVSLTIQDLDVESLTLKIATGLAPRTIGLPSSLVKRLNLYINKFKLNCSNDELFTVNGGKPNTEWVDRRLLHIGERAGFSNFQAKLARNWCASTLLKGHLTGFNLDLRGIQKHMGHVSDRFLNACTVDEEIRWIKIVSALMDNVMKVDYRRLKLGIEQKLANGFELHNDGDLRFELCPESDMNPPSL